MQLIDKNKIISLLSLKLQGMSEENKKELYNRMLDKGLTNQRITEDTKEKDKLDYLIKTCECFNITVDDLVDDGILQDHTLNEGGKQKGLDRL